MGNRAIPYIYALSPRFGHTYQVAKARAHVIIIYTYIYTIRIIIYGSYMPLLISVPN